MTIHAMVPCDEFQAADSVPIEIEKVEGKHDEIADCNFPSRPLVGSAVYRSGVHFLVGAQRFTVQNGGGSPSRLDAWPGCWPHALNVGTRAPSWWWGISRGEHPLQTWFTAAGTCK